MSGHNMKIFIDGQHGAAGVCLLEKLQALASTHSIDIISIEDTKNEEQRYAAIKEADIAVLCLPEEVSAKTCADLMDVNTTIIDASTYHRTLPGWTYAYPELHKNYIAEIIQSKRIANPGCFAGGIMSLLNPIKDYLIDHMPLSMTGVTGYSAGGKKTIEKQKENPLHYRVTNLDREHIHVVEVKHWLHLKNPLAFMPSVSSFERGQLVSMAIFQDQIDISLDSVLLAFQNYYQDFANVTVIDDAKYLIPEKMAGRDDMEIYITKPSHDYLTIHAMYDNLGKGSAGSIANIVRLIVEKQ